ncbi:MAG: hypothetical protein UH239_07005 [Acutalibacteraceae bacterium]|nr:hypothetical protein [Acutalibacteraceae bacterium]
MKYCKKCGIIINNNTENCPNCKKGRVISGEPEQDFPVIAVSAFGFEKERICAALDDDKIPYSTRITRKQFSSDAVTGNNNANYDILVPYTFYVDTINLLVGINAIKPNEKQFKELEKISTQKHHDEFDVEDYYSTKNKIIRMISVILLLAVMAGVVLGVDAVMALIKGFFY